jgi:hypothetical protein
MNSALLNTASMPTRQIPLFKHHKLRNTFNKWRQPSQRLHIEQDGKSKTRRDGRISAPTPTRSQYTTSHCIIANKADPPLPASQTAQHLQHVEASITAASH